MACLLICTMVSVVVVFGLLLVAASTLKTEPERVEDEVRRARRQLFDLTARAYRTMLDEARRQQGGQS